MQISFFSSEKKILMSGTRDEGRGTRDEWRVDTWLSSYVVTWLRGYVVKWIRGYVVT